MELDEVTRWLDAVPVSGTIVELAAGTGWWSTLLAEKGELWVYDADDAALEAARKRLMAHGLLAHLHQRDPLAAADKQVDVVVSACLLGGAATAADLRARVGVVRQWLKPGGVFAFVEVQAPPAVHMTEGPAGPLYPRDTETLRRSLIGGGLQPDEIIHTRSAFVMGRATRPA
jgi:predicted methyltransferase